LTDTFPAERRQQFTSLKALIDQFPTNLDVDAMIQISTAGSIAALPPMSLTVSKPCV
jgi:hypothetical protein